MIFEKELNSAINAARKAGAYLRENRGSVGIAQYKDGRKDFATKQDFGSDKIIIEAIRAEFPNDFILSEESAPEQKGQERMWIIDPLDGTRNYANGLPYFSVSIGLLQGNDPKVGVVYAPCNNDELFHAVRSQGAFLNGQPLKVISPDQDLESTIVATGFAYFKGKDLQEALRIYEMVLNQATDVVRFGSAALDLCHVASGRLGAYYECGLKPWDLAAGALIVQEQSGMISGYDGNELNLFNRANGKFSVDVLAAKNRKIHSQLQGILSSK